MRAGPAARGAAGDAETEETLGGGVAVIVGHLGEDDVAMEPATCVDPREDSELDGARQGFGGAVKHNDFSLAEAEKLRVPSEVRVSVEAIKGRAARGGVASRAHPLGIGGSLKWIADLVHVFGVILRDVPEGSHDSGVRQDAAVDALAITQVQPLMVI